MIDIELSWGNPTLAEARQGAEREEAQVLL